MSSTCVQLGLLYIFPIETYWPLFISTFIKTNSGWGACPRGRCPGGHLSGYQSYYRSLIATHIPAFDWYHFWWRLRTFEGHFSLSCAFHIQYLRNWQWCSRLVSHMTWYIEFQQSFAGFRVARSLSNSWASCCSTSFKIPVVITNMQLNVLRWHFYLN